MAGQVLRSEGVTELSDLPVIKTHWPWYRLFQNRRYRRFAMSQTALRFERDLTEVPFHVDEMQRFLTVRLSIVAAAQRRQSCVLGRLYNRLSGESAAYLRLSGRELRDVLAVIGADMADITEGDAVYDLRADVAREALEILDTVNPV